MCCRLHQSVGPSSVLLSSTDESGARPLVARLWDLAFSVDVSDAALFGGATLADIWERGRIDTKDPLCVALCCQQYRCFAELGCEMAGALQASTDACGGSCGMWERAAVICQAGRVVRTSRPCMRTILKETK